ncbi:hypothetical protein RD792_006728 [Penstemon davidsonii]|uniref:Uncharacterized protein n=1 Tax=Penstemon davidsonii TaxID=160366 RepID=A0ABR0DCI4_9LAMI|nr:hypothetical protein RD792_006728 [Penstemon davidsonii]
MFLTIFLINFLFPASGLLSNEEIAQECVLTGVGLLAGSTILLLTVLWGTCVILGAQKFPNTNFQFSNDIVNQNNFERLLFSLWPVLSALDSTTTFTIYKTRAFGRRHTKTFAKSDDGETLNR